MINSAQPSFGMAFYTNKNCTKILRNTLTDATDMTRLQQNFVEPLHEFSEDNQHNITLAKTPLLKKIISHFKGKKSPDLQLELESKISGDSFRTIGLSSKGLKDDTYLDDKFYRTVRSIKNQNEKDKAFLGIIGHNPETQNAMKKIIR